MTNIAEYIWLDGTEPTQQLRSKTRVLEVETSSSVEPGSFPVWSFDGSSTNQAGGNDSDLLLSPVQVANDPIRGPGNYLVLCEVLNADGTPHKSNTRALLQKIMEAASKDSNPWFGFEQEYTLFSGLHPLGWPENGYPAPQGPFYCGVGSDKVYGRDVVEAHTRMCIEAGIMIYGTNAEVMPGQWEFQIGYRGVKSDTFDAYTLCDHLWMARWLLHRVAEEYDVRVSFDNKPIKGDWNGAGCHTNFSTEAMRDPASGIATINNAIEALSTKHDEHVALYGHGLEERLTGDHETCAIHEFRAGVADRGASIRVPQQVQINKCGYLEDRRPGANCDPYLVSARLITTIERMDEELFTYAKSARQTKKAKSGETLKKAEALLV